MKRKMTYKGLLLLVHFKTFKIRKMIKTITWLPMWWMRKYVPQEQLISTPTSTIRSLCERIQHLEKLNKEYLELWGKTEESLRYERLLRYSKGITPEQKKFFETKLGILLPEESVEDNEKM